MGSPMPMPILTPPASAEDHGKIDIAKAVPNSRTNFTFMANPPRILLLNVA